jgi:hypothetical protein
MNKRNDAGDVHDCDCSCLQHDDGRTAARHSRFTLRMSRQSWRFSLVELFCNLLRQPIGIDERGRVIGAFGLVDALRDCLSSWRRRTVMKPFLNVFKKFNEIDL